MSIAADLFTILYSPRR